MGVLRIIAEKRLLVFCSPRLYPGMTLPDRELLMASSVHYMLPVANIHSVTHQLDAETNLIVIKQMSKGSTMSISNFTYA